MFPQVNLHAGGSVALTVNVGHFALSRNKENRELVQKLIDALIDYDENGPEPEPALDEALG